MMPRYATTIFLSAFLLFQVQPLIGKFVLPWFGGSPGVWTTCMLFFQVALLAGYAYAHYLSSRLSGNWQRGVHLTLLAVSLCFLPIAPQAELWKPSAGAIPSLRILALLAATIGLPYFLLSSTGPLLQESFRRETGRPPYRLYALSNVGSLLALLTYPFVFEPQLKLGAQIVAWSYGYAVFAALCGVCAWRLASLPAVAAAVGDKKRKKVSKPEVQPAARDVAWWLALAACGSVMLLATTNQLTQEVPPVPFLWVVPLALYLLTFVICFDSDGWYHRPTFSLLLAVAVTAAGYALWRGQQLPMWQQLTIYPAALFACCMVCHGELARTRPSPRYATLFYLVVSAGGALGGLLVAIVAPLLFEDFWEFPLGLVATVALSVVGLWMSEGLPARLSKWEWAGGVLAAVGVTVGLGAWLFKTTPGDTAPIARSRNFYGVLRVGEGPHPDDPNGPRRLLTNGRIEHGLQYLDATKSRWPTTYYVPTSGVGLAIAHHPRRAATDPTQRNLRIGVVGLGAGTLAASAQSGDYLRFYEINPEVIRISNEFFTYRKNSAATIDVVEGDARIEMERELGASVPGNFDVLVIDAFTSDSIPIHLLTLECVKVYTQHLKPDGILCIHLTNIFLDLCSVIRGISLELDLSGVIIDHHGDTATGAYLSTWVLFGANPTFFNDPAVLAAVQASDKHVSPLVIWTDDYASLWQVLKELRRWTGR
jgi:spermidine synthase